MSSIQATPSDDRGGRAFKPGPRWAFLAGVAALVAAGLLVVLNSGGSSSHHSSQNLTYGSLPSWLPKSAKDTATSTKYEVATTAKPILEEEQGYTVHAELGSGSADVTAVGPQFPAYVSTYAQSNQWPSGKLVPSTFYVTFARVNGTIPLSAHDFSVVTQEHQVEAARVSVRGGGTVPASLRTGQTITLLVHTETLEGQGAIGWTPQGKKTLVAWIYQLELD
jgi:hypothetical protein